jgi:hypothetical protein
VPLFVVLAVLVLVTSTCAHQPPPVDPAPGFLAGLRDGFLIFFSLVGSLFTDVRIYAFPNAGGAYDLGYFIGAASFLAGGGSRSRARGGGPGHDRTSAG